MPTIEVTDQELQLIKDKLGVDSFKEISNYEDLIGSKYFFRTVTYFMVGEVQKIVGRFVYLKNASWIADTGGNGNTFSGFIKDGINTSTEVEPVGVAFVNLDSVVDFFVWKHELPKKQQ